MALHQQQGPSSVLSMHPGDVGAFAVADDGADEKERSAYTLRDGHHQHNFGKGLTAMTSILNGSRLRRLFSVAWNKRLGAVQWGQIIQEEQLLANNWEETSKQLCGTHKATPPPKEICFANASLSPYTRFSSRS